jgi:hypothetical protein
VELAGAIFEARWTTRLTSSTRKSQAISANGALTFYRNKNPNGLSPTLHEDDDRGPWLRLAVARDAYLGATDGDPTRCDCCELRDDKLPLGTPVWYSFELRAEPNFPIVDARCVCAQIKAPYYDQDGGSPLFSLRIDRGRYVATVEHLYECKDVDFIDGSEIARYVKPYEGPGSCPDGRESARSSRLRKQHSGFLGESLAPAAAIRHFYLRNDDRYDDAQTARLA